MLPERAARGASGSAGFGTPVAADQVCAEGGEADRHTIRPQSHQQPSLRRRQLPNLAAIQSRLLQHDLALPACPPTVAIEVRGGRARTPRRMQNLKGEAPWRAAQRIIRPRIVVEHVSLLEAKGREGTRKGRWNRPGKAFVEMHWTGETQVVIGGDGHAREYIPEGMRV